MIYVFVTFFMFTSFVPLFMFKDESEETSRIAANSPSTQNLVRTHSGKVRVVRSVASTPVERATALRVPGDGSALSRSPSRADPSRGRIDTVSGNCYTPFCHMMLSPCLELLGPTGNAVSLTYTQLLPPLLNQLFSPL